MNLLSVLASASFLLALGAAASPSYAHIDARSRAISTRHSKLARDMASASGTRITKRCKAKTTKKQGSTAKPKATSTKKVSTATPKPTTAAPATAPKGVIDVTSCGPTGATVQTTSTTGPNGSIEFLNRGITSKGGWDPCHITVDQLIAVDLSTAIKQNNSPFQACSQYVSLFNKYGNQFGIHPIMLASFAMQESSCQADAQGEGGEQGLMQLSQDKCGDAPGGNCKDANYNIKTGAQFFSDTLASNNGNVLLSVGNYNGWSKNMTQAQATAARNSNCCRCQNNLDYLDQYFNGWMQGIDGGNLGKFFNLKDCPP